MRSIRIPRGAVALALFAGGCAASTVEDASASRSARALVRWTVLGDAFRERVTGRAIAIPDHAPSVPDLLESTTGPDGVELYSYCVLESDTIGTYRWSSSGKLERLIVTSAMVASPRGGRVGLDVATLVARIGELSSAVTEEGVIVWGEEEPQFSFVVEAAVRSIGRAGIVTPIVGSVPYSPSDTVRVMLWARSPTSRRSDTAGASPLRPR